MLRGHHKIGLNLRVISMHITAFPEVNVQHEDIYLVGKTSNIILGA